MERHANVESGSKAYGQGNIRRNKKIVYLFPQQQILYSRAILLKK